MGYFNFFDEWGCDPKVQLMSEHMQRRHAMLLCLRNLGETKHSTDSEVARYMRISMREALKTKEEFRAHGFIDGDGWNVRKWEERQLGQCESAERVRRHRARKRAESLQSNVTVTTPVTDPTYLLTPVTNNTPEQPKKGKPDKPAFVLPDWVPLNEWNAYVELRCKLKKPLTDHARDLAVKRLASLKAQGHNPAEVLNQCILGGNQGLHPVGYGRSTNGQYGKPNQPHREPEKPFVFTEQDQKNWEAAQKLAPKFQPLKDD